MTKILNFALKIKGGGREGGTCEVLRPGHPLKIWNVHQHSLSSNLRVTYAARLCGGGGGGLVWGAAALGPSEVPSF